MSSVDINTTFLPPRKGESFKLSLGNYGDSSSLYSVKGNPGKVTINKTGYLQVTSYNIEISLQSNRFYVTIIQIVIGNNWIIIHNN